MCFKLNRMRIETPRLLLREISAADLGALRAILQDDKTMTAHEGAFDDQMMREWLQRTQRRYREHGFGLWAVVERETDAMIGQCGLTRQQILEDEVVEVG